MRRQIDAVDEKIQELVSERARYAQQAGEVKNADSSSVEYYRPDREAEVLRAVVDRNDGPLSDEEMVRLFREIMSAADSSPSLDYRPYACDDPAVVDPRLWPRFH